MTIARTHDRRPSGRCSRMLRSLIEYCADDSVGFGSGERVILSGETRQEADSGCDHGTVANGPMIRHFRFGRLLQMERQQLICGDIHADRRIRATKPARPEPKSSNVPGSGTGGT